MSQNLEYIKLIFVLIGYIGFAWPGFSNGGLQWWLLEQGKGVRSPFPKETMCNELTPITISCSLMLFIGRK